MDYSLPSQNKLFFGIAIGVLVLLVGVAGISVYASNVPNSVVETTNEEMSSSSYTVEKQYYLHETESLDTGEDTENNTSTREEETVQTQVYDNSNDLFKIESNNSVVVYNVEENTMLRNGEWTESTSGSDSVLYPINLNTDVDYSVTGSLYEYKLTSGEAIINHPLLQEENVDTETTVTISRDNKVEKITIVGDRKTDYLDRDYEITYNFSYNSPTVQESDAVDPSEFENDESE